MCFSVVCSLIDNDIRHHSGQNVAPRESTTNFDHCVDEYGWMENAECGVRSVENEEYRKCGVWKMRSIACGNALTFLFNIKNA